MIKELIVNNRSYRRFDNKAKLKPELIKELIDLARLSPSGNNIQPLKYIYSCQPEMNDKIFPHTSWAGYIEDWDGPEPDERPTGYIIILGDKEIKDSFGYDPGIVAQSMKLGATEKGYGGCIIASIDREELRKTLNLPDRYEILLIFALGKPAETVVLEETNQTGDIKYYRDKKNIHHVPKRSLYEIILKEYS